MLNWLKRRRPVPVRLERAAASPAGSNRSGKSASLYKYLNDRYADAVVLTFAEIEDLAGFALPELARRSVEWWTTGDVAGSRPHFADSWVQANRTARPNLQARTVAFDRGV
jgi:hypothetical protein